MDKVVIIEDEQNMRTMLSYLLEQNDFSPEIYNSAEDFLNNQNHYNHCIYLIDSRLPGIQGPDVIRAIRMKDKISPIFIVSAANEQDEIGKGLKAGADDYVTKPFHPEHLITKVKNAHSRNATIFEKVLAKGPRLNPEAQAIMKEGLVVYLTKREFKLMSLLLNYPNKIVSREYLMKGLGDEGSARNIDTLVFALRKKLRVIDLEIETIRSQGYRLKVF